MTQPTIMPFADADQSYELADRLNAWEDDEDVTVYVGGAQIETLDLEQVGPCVVAGDLVVSGEILGMDEEAGYLVVLGSCRARNLLLGAPEVWVDGDVVIENGVLADYNHGVLTVGGDLVAAIVCAEHMVSVGGTVRGISIDFGGFRVKDPEFAPTLSRKQAVYEAKDHFVPEVLNDQGYVNGRGLFERMLQGAPILLAG